MYKGRRLSLRWIRCLIYLVPKRISNSGKTIGKKQPLFENMQIYLKVIRKENANGKLHNQNFSLNPRFRYS